MSAGFRRLLSSGVRASTLATSFRHSQRAALPVVSSWGESEVLLHYSCFVAQTPFCFLVNM